MQFLDIDSSGSKGMIYFRKTYTGKTKYKSKKTKGPFIISTRGGPVATSKTPHKNTWPPPLSKLKSDDPPLG